MDSSLSQPLGYEPRSPRFGLRRIHYILLFISLISIAYVGIALTGRWEERRTLVCTQCGIYEQRHQSYIPLMPIRYRSSAKQTATPVSTVLSKHQLRVGHSHQFVTAYGNECGINPPRCTLWIGHNVDVTNSAVFLDNVIKYSDKKIASKWIDLALDPYGNQRLFYSTITSVPPAGFPDKASFQSWWTKHQPALDALARE